MAASQNVGGALVGRNVLFPGSEDPSAVAGGVSSWSRIRRSSIMSVVAMTPSNSGFVATLRIRARYSCLFPILTGSFPDFVTRRAGWPQASIVSFPSSVSLSRCFLLWEDFSMTKGSPTLTSGHLKNRFWKEDIRIKLAGSCLGTRE